MINTTFKLALNHQYYCHTKLAIGFLKSSLSICNVFSSICNKRGLSSSTFIKNYSVKKISTDATKKGNDREIEKCNEQEKNGTKKVLVIENGISESFNSQKFLDSAKPYSKIHLDLGTGDAKFVYHQAKANPNTFFVGVDTNPCGMRSISMKVRKKPSRGGGISNVAFIHAHAEDLPSELNDFADSISINFPWAGLLQTVILPDSVKLRKISDLGKNNSSLKILLNNDVFQNKDLCKKENLPVVNQDYINNIIKSKYKDSCINLNNHVVTPLQTHNTSWGKKLVLGSQRCVLVFDCTIRRNSSFAIRKK